MGLIIDLLIDFIYPKRCVGCDLHGVFLCDDCRECFDYADQICPECCEGSVVGWVHEKCRKRWGMDGLIAVYEYREEKMRKVIDEIKYGFNRELVSELVEKMVFEFGEKFDLIVPVPLYFYRENWRGFNQAEEIARGVGEGSGLKLANVLKRIRNTKQQSSLETKKERIENMKKAFVVKDEFKKILTRKRVLLVDDVFTSGAGMRECCKALKKAGVEMVWGFVLAR